jgi:hypothetical protein
MWTGCGIPPISPRGYHTATRGQSYPRPRRSYQGLPPSRRAVGLRLSTECHRAPACKIIRDRQAAERHHDLRYAAARADTGRYCDQRTPVRRNARTDVDLGSDEDRRFSWPQF